VTDGRHALWCLLDKDLCATEGWQQISPVRVQEVLFGYLLAGPAGNQTLAQLLDFDAQLADGSSSADYHLRWFQRES
jgi:hypothetical protein